MKICIDAGHGGTDPGAVGTNGLSEASVNLDISNYLASILEGWGLAVKETRSSDVFVELSRRCSIANGWNADYFVSIHCNSNGSSAVGIETLYKTQKGKELATPIQAAMISASGDRDMGLVHRDDLYVLNGTAMPACLAEVGFISNPETETKFLDPAYWQTLTRAIATGIAEFLNLKSPSIPLR